MTEDVKEGETLPTWLGDAQNDWPDYERILDELASIANNEERETMLRSELAKTSFLVKQQHRSLGNILWFPAMAVSPHKTNTAPTRVWIGRRLN